MPLDRLDGEQAARVPPSRLERSLLRLHCGEMGARHEDDASESQFEMWRQQWSRNAEQIARRLELLEAQLTDADAAPEPVRHLTLLAAPPDAKHVTLVGEL